MTSEQEAMRNLSAARVAIGAAIREAGPRMEIGELISGMVSIFSVQPGMNDPSRDRLAVRVMIDVVRLVGARRAHEIVDMVTKAGAGSAFQ